MELTSINNEKVKFWSKLKQKKYRDKEKKFIVEDEHLVNEAIKNNIVLEIITVTKDKKYSYPTYYVNDKIMKFISSQETYPKVIAVCSMMYEQDYSGNILILDRIQDPGNLGTIIRSAVAFNFHSIILSNDSVDLYNPKVLRATEGMIFNINVIRTDLKTFIKGLDNSYMTISTDVNAGNNIKDLEYDKCAIVIGNEGSGVSEDIKNLCDSLVHIKMSNDCESLNASISASILMYEVYNG